MSNQNKLRFLGFFKSFGPIMANAISIEINGKLGNHSLLDLINNKILDGSQFIGHEFLSVNDGKDQQQKID